uniref:Ribosomal protein S20 n=1 Tax=Rhodymenia pseudopalmata TaxID=31502 RepID=A0A1C9C7F9_RHOPU|nr:ribosomal protein S20 [Rhodymenia pseudopalmata]AOM64313.1 ribosomal protein S20 [Rhodymenia pseudopalmata]
MSKNLSAIKKNQISLRNRAINKIYKSAIKTLTKKYLLSLKKSDSLNIDSRKFYLSAVYQKIDKAVKKGVLHKNNGARKKAMLARLVKTSLSM